jgi:chromosome transmission fidelity protein 1
MKYYDGLGLNGLDGKGYYESLCLKAINQTIGRAIRHGKDWAEIFLVDKRFEGVKGKLSEWMRRSVQVVEDLEELIKCM